MILVRPCRDKWAGCVKYCKKNFELNIFLFEYSRIAFKLNILCGVLKVSAFGGIIGRLLSKKKKKVVFNVKLNL